MGKKRTETLLEIPVEFGNVNVGDKTAKVGVRFDRSAINLEDADEKLCERRLQGTILAKPAGWKADQQALPGMSADHELKGTFDVKGLSLSKDHIACGFTFALAEINVGDLAGFAKRSGRVAIWDSAPIPGGEDESDSDE